MIFNKKSPNKTDIDILVKARELRDVLNSLDDKIKKILEISLCIKTDKSDREVKVVLQEKDIDIMEMYIKMIREFWKEMKEIEKFSKL